MSRERANREQIYLNADNCFTVNEPLGIKALTFTWMPSWWKATENIVMGERYVLDPDYRVDAAVRMARAVAKRFPMMSIGDADAQPTPIMPNWINATTASGAGSKVIYSDDNFPATTPLSADVLKTLKPPESIEALYPYSEVIRQVEYLNEKHGTDLKPHLFKNGTSNDLIQLMGDLAMTEAMEDTELFRHVL